MQAGRQDIRAGNPRAPSLWTPLLSREVNPESGSFSQPALHAYQSLGLLCHPVDHREAQAVGGGERLLQARSDVRLFDCHSEETQIP